LKAMEITTKNPVSMIIRRLMVETKEEEEAMETKKEAMKIKVAMKTNKAMEIKETTTKAEATTTMEEVLLMVVNNPTHQLSMDPVLIDQSATLVILKPRRQHTDQLRQLNPMININSSHLVSTNNPINTNSHLNNTSSRPSNTPRLQMPMAQSPTTATSTRTMRMPSTNACAVHQNTVIIDSFEY